MTTPEIKPSFTAASKGGAGVLEFPPTKEIIAALNMQPHIEGGYFVETDRDPLLIHEDGRVETFVVGQDVARGERLQWIVEGNKYKASFLLPDREGGQGSDAGLLISETVVPGFEFCDHDFLTRSGLRDLLGEEGAKELEWLVRKDE